MQYAIEHLWLALATILVLGMQGGFLLLEAGRVRSKNSISVAEKNVADLVISWVAFYLIGYWLMFGQIVPGLPGAQGAVAVSNQAGAILMFLYQLGFCAAAASIVSGGVAERMTFRAYLALTCVTAALVYPIVGRWVWSDLGSSWNGAWLKGLGFVDFAGSTVVHGVGAWVALTAIIALGPRLGRFDEKGNVLPISGHNAVISLFGTLILLLGWFGFNAGSVSPLSPVFAKILLNTCTAAAFGALAGMMIGAYLDKGNFNPSRIISGLLGGLVGITAGAHLAAPLEAGLLGATAGAVSTWGAQWLLERWRLDDPLDVVATHGMAGVVGTLAVAWLGKADQLPAGGRLEQASVQMLGVLTVFVLTSSLTWLALKGLRKLMPIRVTEEQERIGLNHTEHGEALGAERLQRALNNQLSHGIGSSKRLITDDGDDSSELAFAMNQLLDVHESARDEIESARVRFKDFATTASDWLWETNSAFQIAYLSSSKEGPFATDSEKLIGCKFGELVKLSKESKQQVAQAARARRAFGPVDASVTLADAATILVVVRGTPYFDAQGTWLGYRGTFNDVTERRSAERRAVFLSRHDELTGLENRRALADDIEALRRDMNEMCGLVIAAVDLDGFKAVNDAYGHGVGDSLLKEVAGRLSSSIRSADRLYRTGGDEFVIVLTQFKTESMLEDGTAWCERLIGKLSRPYEILSRRLELGASIGIALYPLHAEETNDLVRLADLALYAAKANGKGRVEIFDASMDTEARHQMQLENQLREAVRDNQFFLEYQPQFAGDGTRITGFEALIRWQHPTMGRLAPDTFLPVAERLKLMSEIGSFALIQACQFAMQWSTHPHHGNLRIAVNVSPSQFSRGNVIADVKRALSLSGLAPHRLELEITEKLLIEDVQGVRKVLGELRDMGVSIAIDDFGSGQTSLQYLDQFPITKLKIDRAFVRNLENDVRAQDIAQSIVMLGHKLGCVVTAEGVEEASQADLLRTWHCDELQGYMYSKPLSMTSVLSLLADDGANAVQHEVQKTTRDGLNALPPVDIHKV